MPRTIRNEFDKKLTYENLMKANIDSKKGKSLRKEIILFNLKQEEYIIGDRENGKNDEQIKQILKEKLIKLYKNREILKELSKENLESIEEYDGGKIIKEFENYFNECLK